MIVLLIALLGLGAWGILRLTGLFQSEKPPEEVSSSLPEEPSSSIPEPEPEPEPEPVQAVSTDDWRLLLVNSENPLPEGFEPPELDLVDGTYQVDSRISDSIKRMFAEAKRDGIALMICSGYRPVDYQQKLFDKQVAQHISDGKSEEEAQVLAATAVARPGTSEHHTGLAVDIVEPEYQMLNDGFADTPAAKWLLENAYKYGFILRYPKDKSTITGVMFEPWHYRYVGEETALLLRERGLTLEEYWAMLEAGSSFEAGGEESSGEDAASHTGETAPTSQN